MTWLIFVDDLHINFRDTGRLRQLLRSIATELMRDEDVFAMRSSGPAAIALGPGSDRARLDAAIRTVTGAGLKASEIAAYPMLGRDEIGFRLGSAFTAATELLGNVPASPERRRVMLYISNGYEPERGHASATSFAAAAQRADVSVFAMNAAALPSQLAANAGVNPTFWKQVEDSRRQTLRAIADPTGGFALLDDVDFADAMPRVRAAATRISK